MSQTIDIEIFVFNTTNQL